MKHIIVVSIIGTVIVLGSFAAINLTPKKENPVVKPANIIQTLSTQSEMVDTTPKVEAVPTPVTTETATVPNTPPTTVAPVVIKTTDDYVNQYFPTSNSEVIKNVKIIVSASPERFTSGNIDASFVYLQKYFAKPLNSNPDIALDNFAW
jgi:hypothetical protein